MRKHRVRDILGEILPDSRIESDARALLVEIGDQPIELESGSIVVPMEVRLDVIRKCYVLSKPDWGFGEYYLAILAVGGVSELKFGVAHAKFCYLDIYYNNVLEKITQDFYSRTPRVS